MNNNENNPSFREGFQVAWDSVSRGALKTCPRYYQLSIIQGWQLKTHEGFSQSVDLIFGIWMHSSRELYYKERHHGASHDDALDKTVDYVLKVTWNRQLQRPWASQDSNKNRFTLLRSVVWYLDQWGEDDPLETIKINGKEAIELTFKLDSEIKINGYDIILAGHIDRAVTFGNNGYGTDLKTTKHTLNSEYFRQYSPNDQMSGYSWALERLLEIPFRGIIIDAAQILVSGTRFLRGASPRTHSQINEWFEGFRELVHRAHKYYEDQFYPMNEKACFRCDFKKICERSLSSRESLLRNDYEQRQWNPLEQRGDI